MDYVRVASEAALAEIAGEDGAFLLCGGTDVLVRLHAGTIRPRLLVDVSRIPSLREVSPGPDGATIGAAVPIAELLAARDIREGYPLLAAALRTLGSVQIRNRATLGGNLANASPAADSAPALLAYDASVTLAARDGERSMPVAEFLVGPGRTALRRGEYVRSVALAPAEPDDRVVFHKVGRRRALTIAIASVAGRVSLRDGAIARVHLAAGSVAPVPVRLRRTEQLLVGRRADDDLARAAADCASGEVSPIDDIRASAAYRREVVGQLVARFVLGRRSA